MARTKREAQEAVSSLQAYLRRDNRGRELLASVVRYIGELRHSVSDLRSRLEDSETECIANAESRTRGEMELLNARAEIERLQAIRVQQTQEIERLRSEVECLSAEPEDSDDDVVAADATVAFRAMIALQKQIMREFPKCPEATTHGFQLEDFVTSFSSAEYLRLGRFVTFMSLFMGRCYRFVHDADKRFEKQRREYTRKRTERQEDRLVGWLMPAVGKEPRWRSHIHQSVAQSELPQ